MREQLMNGLMVLLAAIAAVEVGYAWWARRDVHTFRDSVSSVANGLGQQSITIFLGASFLGAYAWLADHAPIHANAGVWWHWVLLMLGIDLCYYAGHRTMHSVNFFVAGHVVHHQALDFSHVSAFRQGWTAWIVVFPFFLPLAALGVPVEMFVIGQTGIMFLQFFAHNGTFKGRLGFLEGVLQTPANHHVHHGLNAPYRNQNYGGMFVIWDRVFGTYVENDPAIPIVMGAGMDVNFHDPFEANLDYYRRIVFVMNRRPTLWGKVAIWLQSPRVLIKESKALRYDEIARMEPLVRGPLSRRDQAATLAVLAMCGGLLFVHRLSFDGNPLLARIATGAAVLGMLWVLGRLLTRGPVQSAAFEPEALGRSEVNAR